GTFSAKTRNARTGRNPATGEEIKIPEKTSAAFKPASALKDL
ncbi:MAG: HU family DNA-binding protein, partial [Hyphomonas sp.]|nr:HU family DNA-binding protein [Hyphomonas sp.]